MAEQEQRAGDKPKQSMADSGTGNQMLESSNNITDDFNTETVLKGAASNAGNLSNLDDRDIIKEDGKALGTEHSEENGAAMTGSEREDPKVQVDGETEASESSLPENQFPRGKQQRARCWGAPVKLKSPRFQVDTTGKIVKTMKYRKGGPTGGRQFSPDMA